MRKLTLIGLLTIFVTSAYSQIKFEKGYFIDNDGNRTECLIKDLEWGYNPTTIEYKIDENSESKKIDVNSMKEFGVGNSSKYISRTVNIDRSSEVLSELTASPDPVFKQERLLLKALVEGTANLYYFEDRNVKRFFYSMNDAPVEQLIFKTYRSQVIGTTGKLGENTRFRQQLFNSLQCFSIDRKRFEKLGYKKGPLISVFTEYNAACGKSVVNYQEKTKRKAFNLNLRPRANFSSLSASNPNDGSAYDWGSKTNFGMGLEGEYFLSFNKGKWSIILEPTFQYFNATTTAPQPHDATIILVADVNYKSFEVPLGVRHYFYLNEKSRVFVNGSAIFDVVRHSSNGIDIRRKSGSAVNNLMLGSEFNFGFGAGYRYEAFAIEARFQTTRDILGSYMGWRAEYKTTSIILSYSLFGSKP